MERRRMLGIGAGLAVLPAWWGLRRVASDPGGGWHTDSEPLERAFPLIGPLTGARWVSSRDDDRGVPAPELVISGLARLAPGRLDRLTAVHPFEAARPPAEFSSWFERPLKGQGPKDPQWIRSPYLDRDGSGPAVRLWFDRRSSTVRFWALNPYG